MIEEIFKFYSANFGKLENFGFEKIGDKYQYCTTILDEGFDLIIYVFLDGKIKTRVVDKMTKEEYVLHQVGGTGDFVGKVRAEYERVLNEIRDECFERKVFKSSQSNEVINYISEKFGGKLEFLWEKFPTDAIWRRNDNKKWYGAIMTIPKNKLGFESEEIVEVIDVRATPEYIEKNVDDKTLFRGYHMNKKHWLTIVLDGSVKSSEVFALIDTSFELAKK